MSQKYTLSRHFQATFESEVIAHGFTLREVQKHCKSVDAHSSTCTHIPTLKQTEGRGPWFDGYRLDVYFDD